MTRSSTRRTTGNAVSLLASDVANRAATFVLYALVARYVGASDFGRMSLALTFFYVFQTFAVAGLKTLIIREVAKDRTKTAQYLVNGSAVVVVTSLVSISILLLFVRLVQYSAETTSVILLLSLALLPYSMASICEAVFQAWEAMHYFAYTNVSVNVAKVGLAFLMLSQGYGLYHLVILLLVCHVASAALEWRLVLRHITRPRSGIDLHFSLAMSRATSTFLGIDSLIAIVGSLNVVLLSKLVGETEVGLYSAAVQLLAPMHLIFMSIVLSVFPMMCRRFEPSFHGLKQISEHLIALLMSIALPMTVGMFFLANSVLLFLYGDKEFLLASGALRIVIWNLVLVALTSVFGQVLIASLREKVALRIVATDALVTLGLGLLLIRPFGVIGAAVTALLTGLADFLQHFVPVSRLFASISWGRLLWKPVVATVCMAVFLIAVHPDEGLLTVVVAGTVYTGVLCALTIWSVGGPRQLKSKYLYLWSENGTPGVMWSPADE